MTLKASRIDRISDLIGPLLEFVEGPFGAYHVRHAKRGLLVDQGDAAVSRKYTMKGISTAQEVQHKTQRTTR